MSDTFNFENAQYSELYAEAKRVTMELEMLQNKMMYVEKAFANRDRQFTQGKALIQELIENEEIDNEHAVKQLVEIYGIEILKEVNFTITIEISGSVEIPLGSELDEYSFNVDSLSYENQDVSFSQDNVEITDWNFAE